MVWPYREIAGEPTTKKVAISNAWRKANYMKTMFEVARGHGGRFTPDGSEEIE